MCSQEMLWTQNPVHFPAVYTENPVLRKNSAKPSWIKTCKRPKLSELSADPRCTQIYWVIILTSTLLHSMALYQSKCHSSINILLAVLMVSRLCVSQIWLWISNKVNVLQVCQESIPFIFVVLDFKGKKNQVLFMIVSIESCL